jgi:general secretion pathway protein H
MSAIGSSRGFTLLELLVVIAILSLMAAAIPLTLNRVLPARRLASATDQLVANIQWLQAHSTALGKTAHLEITADGYELRVLNSGKVRSVLVPSPIRVKFAVPMVGQESAILRVYPEGTTSGAEFEVNDGRSQLRVLVSVITGKVRRVEGP